MSDKKDLPPKVPKCPIATLELAAKQIDETVVTMRETTKVLHENATRFQEAGRMAQEALATLRGTATDSREFAAVMRRVADEVHVTTVDTQTLAVATRAAPDNLQFVLDCCAAARECCRNIRAIYGTPQSPPRIPSLRDAAALIKANRSANHIPPPPRKERRLRPAAMAPRAPRAPETPSRDVTRPWKPNAKTQRLDTLIGFPRLDGGKTYTC